MELLADPGVNRYTLDGRAVAIRPEHVSLTAMAEPTLQLPLRVTAYETNGNEYFVHATAEETNDEWVLRGRGMVNVEIGQSLPGYVRHADMLSF